MGCIPAPTCKKALADATAKWPNRRRGSDGICGDAAHQARKSDHNTGDAFDLSHDPQNGPDCHLLSRDVINDPRVKYVIFAGQIYRTYKPDLGWAAYTGPNRHDHHMHVSIKAGTRDDLSPWPWSVPFKRSVLRRGDTGTAVQELQRKLSVKADGAFGPLTELAVREYQLANGLEGTGIADDATNALLWPN